MKRLVLILTALVLGTAIGSASLTTSRVRKETRFLTDKMAYELNLTTAQYNDVYEINFDFIYNIRDLMPEVVMGYEWALEDYYDLLDWRNDDLRWVLSSYQYHRFLQADHFYRPICVTGGGWAFRIYFSYTDRNHFFFPKPHHYKSYSGGHCRLHHPGGSFYQGRHDQPHYALKPNIREDKNFRTTRQSDFGSVNIRPNTSRREVGSSIRRSASSSSTRTSGNVSSRSTRSSRSTATEARPSGSSSRSSNRGSTSRSTSTRTSTRSSESSVRSSRSSSRGSSSKGSTRSTSSRSSSRTSRSAERGGR